MFRYISSRGSNVSSRRLKNYPLCSLRRENGVGDSRGHQGQTLTTLKRDYGMALGVPRTHERHYSTHTWASRHVWCAPRGCNDMKLGVTYLFHALA